MRGPSVFILLAAAAGSMAQPKQMVCATCHVKEAASQPATPMARALLLPGANSTLKAHPSLSFQYGKFTYSVETRSGRSTYSVTDGANTLTLPITWTFGSDAQTFILTREGSYFESMVSYYPAIGGLDITVGDQALKPRTVEEAMGRRLEISVVTACFDCHSTHSVTDHKLSLQSLTPGVTCERCHADAAAHLNAMRGGAGANADMPERLGKRSAESISEFCGQCHRTWETVVRNNWRGPMDVRFQPYRLAISKCFDGTDARISCVACHNPHENVIRRDDPYDAKCLACHRASANEAKVCPVSKTSCTTCHMPKVQLPGGHQIFTDHDIRVVKPGESYPN